MSSNEVRPGSAIDDARDAAHKARRRWADEVVQALAERRMSINAAAREIGISPGRLQAWLNQDVEPSPRVMRDLARVVGRSHVHLLQLLEWLPQEMSAAPLRLEATEKLNEAIGEARRWLRSATRAAGLRGGNQIAGAVLDASDEWDATVRNSTRGFRYPTRYAMRVGFRPLHQKRNATTENERRRIERLIFDTMLRTAAQWLPPDSLADLDWTTRPDLVLAVPSLCASRPRGQRPNLLVPPSIVVVGVSFAGSQEVAALLADLLDWAYLDVRALAVEQFELASDTALMAVERAEVSTARRLIEDPNGLGRQVVWSYSNPKPILQTFRQLGPELPLVILLRAPDSVLSYLTQRLADDEDPNVDLVEAAQNLVRRTVEQTRPAETYLILDVPDLPLGSGDANEIDLVFDAYVELAFAAATWLHDKHGAPSLRNAGGVLGCLWRDARRRSSRHRGEDTSPA